MNGAWGWGVGVGSETRLLRFSLKDWGRAVAVQDLEHRGRGCGEQLKWNSTLGPLCERKLSVTTLLRATVNEAPTLYRDLCAALAVFRLIVAMQ